MIWENRGSIVERKKGMFCFLEKIKKNADTVAFGMINGEESFTVTYSDYYDKVCRCAYNLKERFGDISGIHFGIFMESSYDYTVLLCALFFSRAVAIPLNIRDRAENIQYEIEHSDTDKVIVDDTDSLFFEGVEAIKLSALMDPDKGRLELTDFTDAEASKDILMIYTSGTTGRPKGVSITAGNLFGYSKLLFDIPFESERWKHVSLYSNFPFYHIGGINGWITHFEHGCSAYLSVNPGNILTDLEYHKMDVALVTPATLKLWRKALLRGHSERLGGLKLIITAGAPVDTNIVKIFMDNGIKFGQIYGMSESTGFLSTNFDCINHISSVGRPAPMVEAFVMDNEICIKGPGVMRGYYKDKRATDEAIIDGILHTGDLGYIDEDGYIYITGRKKNLIILSGGENVSPEELESLMNSHSSVRECKAFEKDDRIYMAVYADDSDRDAIREYVTELNKTLPIYKRIYGIEFQNCEFEKTSSGKIKRNVCA